MTEVHGAVLSIRACPLPRGYCFSDEVLKIMLLLRSRSGAPILLFFVFTSDAAVQQDKTID